MSSTDNNLPNSTVDKVQNSNSNQTEFQIPESQVQNSQSEQNVVLAATGQNGMAAAANSGEPSKNPKANPTVVLTPVTEEVINRALPDGQLGKNPPIPPETYSQFSEECRDLLEDADRTLKGKLKPPTSTPSAKRYQPDRTENCNACWHLTCWELVTTKW